MSAKICKEYNKIVNTIKSAEMNHLAVCRHMTETFKLRWSDDGKYKKLKALIEERQRNLKTELIIKTKNS